MKQSADGQLIDRAAHCAVICKRLRSAVDERLSRDLALHDRVIQQLFAIGMAMQTTELRSAQPEAAKRIADHLDGLHAVVQEMRAALQDVAVGTRAGRQGTGSVDPPRLKATIGEDNRVLPADDHSAGQRGHTALTQKGLRNVGRRRGNGQIMAGSASDSLACLPVDPVVPGPAFTLWGYR